MRDAGNQCDVVQAVAPRQGPGSVGADPRVLPRSCRSSRIFTDNLFGDVLQGHHVRKAAERTNHGSDLAVTAAKLPKELVTDGDSVIG